MIFLVILIAIKLLGFINGILELYNVAVLVKNKAAVAFVDFITEVVAATFIAGLPAVLVVLLFSPIVYEVEINYYILSTTVNIFLV